MLDWSLYDAERRRKARGVAGLDDAQRQAIEGLLTRALGLAAADAAATWGDAIGYGLDAAVVVRIRDGVPHAHAAAGFPVAIKVYRRRVPRLVAWHTWQFPRVRGFATNPRVQQSVTAGEVADGGRRRSFAVVQYVPGVLLESWLAANGAPPPDRALALLREIFELLFDLWAVGLRPWDIRPGNLVLESSTGRLTLIDTDACQGIFEEVVEKPEEWWRRDAVEDRFLRRLPANVIGQILLGRKPGLFGRDRTLVKRAGAALADTGLSEAMRALGRPDAAPDADRQARTALDAVLGQLHGM